jgi:ATP-dependent Clp protease ATP-binding subunit ClpA
MFERFTPQAREIARVAFEEARLMRHAHIGTEHLLVALARGEDDAAALLHRHGLTGESARAEVVKLAGMGETVADGQLPFTPAAKDALEQTLEEAMRLGHENAEPGHILLAILRQQDALARRMLLAAGAAPRDVRAELIERLARKPRSLPRDPGAPVGVWLDEVPIGDLGHPNVDGRLLLEMLERHGAVAAWLRERGVDEAAVRRMLGEPQA